MIHVHRLIKRLGHRRALHFSPYPFSLRGMATYEVSVFTGDVRGAGTKARVFLSLEGDHGITEQSNLTPPNEHDEFRRGSVESFTLETNDDLGELRSLTIGHDESALGSGWYLSKVEVIAEDDVQQPSKRYTFLCNRWLGVSDSGGLSGPPLVTLSAAPIVDKHKAPLGGVLLRRPLVIMTSATAVPHKKKVQEGHRGVVRKDFGYGGEDAYFVISDSGFTVLGVADGVYGWREQGIDAGNYSRSLMSRCARLCKEQPEVAIEPRLLMELAWKEVQEAAIMGSSTACVVSINHLTGILRSANIGDSGYMVLRNGGFGLDLIYRSRQQEHSFGIPFQMGHPDYCDKPSAADLNEISVQGGDVIILGSDGLWDNLSEEVIMDLSTPLRPSKPSITALVQTLAEKAFRQSQNKKTDTPYSRAATEEFDMIYSGGKQDDITIVAACVQPTTAVE